MGAVPRHGDIPRAYTVLYGIRDMWAAQSHDWCYGTVAHSHTVRIVPHYQAFPEISPPFLVFGRER